MAVHLSFFPTHHRLSRAWVVDAALDVLLFLLHGGRDRLRSERVVLVVALMKVHHRRLP